MTREDGIMFAFVGTGAVIGGATGQIIDGYSGALASGLGLLGAVVGLAAYKLARRTKKPADPKADRL